MISNYHYRFWLYLLLLGLLLVGIGIIVFAQKTSPEGKESYKTLSECFVVAPRIPYFPNTYVLGDIVENVIICESGGDNSKRGKAGEIGLAQFMPSTWEYFNKIRGTNLDIYNEEDQKDMVSWAFEKGENFRRQWTCYKKLYGK